MWNRIATLYTNEIPTPDHRWQAMARRNGIEVPCGHLHRTYPAALSCATKIGGTVVCLERGE